MKTRFFPPILMIVLAICISQIAAIRAVKSRENDTTQGSGIFTDTGQRLGNASSSDVALADLDGDLDLDVFFCNIGQRSGSIPSGEPDEVWLNQGNGWFTRTSQDLGNSRCESVALGDLDGDDDLDAFEANGYGNQPNRVWFNDGNGLFLDSGQNLGNSDSKAVALADLDSDGDLDAFVGNCCGQANQVWLNSGHGTFHNSGQSLGNLWTESVTLADFDNDGDVDAFVGNGAAIGEPDQVWLNDGTGRFVNSGQSLGLLKTSDVAVGDVDGDGDLDVVASSYSESGNQVWLNDGTGVFVAGQTIDDLITRAVALGDLDDDGDIDLVSGNGDFFVSPGGQTNRIWLNNGHGVYRDSGQDIGHLTSESVGLGDVDSDGDLDIVFANGEFETGLPNDVWLNINDFVYLPVVFR